VTLQPVANPDPKVRLSRKVQNAASQCSARTLLQDLTLTAVTCTVAGPSTVSQRNHQENKKQSLLCVTVLWPNPCQTHKHAQPSAIKFYTSYTLRAIENYKSTVW